MQNQLNIYIKKILPDIIKTRHNLHAHPELGFKETKTVEIISNTLDNFDLTIQKGIGKTGLIAVLDSGKPGKTIAIRADFDALTIEEANQFPYKSTHIGIMHACGHDGHTAILLCVAGVLSHIKDQLTGKVIFIFQPAEELGDGAQAMINDGILDQYNIDAIFALHNFPLFPASHITVKGGCVLAGMDAFEIEIHGVAGHASLPEKCLNPISIATDLQTQLAKGLEPIVQKDPLASLNFTQIQSDTSESINIIPKTITLRGITRAASNNTQAAIRKLISEQVKLVSIDASVNASVTFKHTCPPTINSKDATRQLVNVAKKYLGEDKVKLLDHTLAAYDDFAYFLQKVSGCYFFIGNGEDSKMIHTSNYDFNDEIITPATQVFCNLVLDYQE